MRPGEISPVFATTEAMLIYRVEQVRTPEYDQARQMTFEQMVENRSTESQVRTADSLLATAQRAVTDGAPAAALKIASEAGMAEGTIPGSTALVRFVGGSLTAEDLRRLFRVRPELRDGFALSTEAQIEGYLLELAADEVLVQAAEASGFAPTDAERQALQASMADQLADIASQYSISHQFVTNSSFRVDLASETFLRGVLQAQRPVPWLAEFRFVLDPEYPATIYERGAETASRLAVDLRDSTGQDPVTDPEDQAESDEVEPEHVG
jgi:hypothetical protein